MGTGLIYAAIVAAWAVYLVPLWLRRNDEAQAARAGDPMPETSRVLTRRGAEHPTSRPSTESGGPGEADRTDTGFTRPSRADQEPLPGGAAPERSASGADDIDLSELDEGEEQARGGVGRRHARSAPARRGRTMLLLVLATTLVAVLAVINIVPGWSLSIPGTMVVLFALLSAMVGRRERRRAEPGDVPAGPPAGAERRARPPSAAGVGRAAAPEAGERGSAGSQEPFDGETAGARPERRTPTARRPGPRAGQEWDPVSVPLPTYVSKAKAPRTVRTIDLTESDTYSSGRSADAETAAPAARTEPEQEAPAAEDTPPTGEQPAGQADAPSDDLFDQERVRPAVGD